MLHLSYCEKACSELKYTGGKYFYKANTEKSCENIFCPTGENENLLQK